ADITGISAFASDGFISSYADSDVDNIYVFDMSDVSRNGSYGAEGTYGAGLYTEDGSAAGNKWPTNIVNITMAQATDFAEAAIGSKYYATLENALAATGKGGSTCDITMLRSKELTDAAIDTAKTKSIDLNGFNLTGTATITGANGIEIKDTAETAGVMGLTITASEFTGEITNSLAKYEMANNDGVYTFTRITTPIDAAVITGLAAKTYTGAAIKPVPTVKLGDTVLTAGTDYSVAYANNVNAGTAIVTITGQGNYSGTATATFQINKANQKMTVKANTKTLKVKKLKKKARTVSAITATKQGGALSYSGVGTNAKSKKALKINAKTGKITVKKKTKKGTYKMKVTVRSAASTNYNAASKVVTVTIKVKK
ncbi:MAG: hypothetical protein IJH05_00965, partial [Firmicutes bacterium]|nr:hypothetical protein [Bacillota bacterium]